MLRTAHMPKEMLTRPEPIVLSTKKSKPAFPTNQRMAAPHNTISSRRRTRYVRDPNTSPIQKQSNPYANAKYIENGSAGVAKNEVRVAAASQIQSGTSSRCCVRVVGTESLLSGGA